MDASVRNKGGRPRRKEPAPGDRVSLGMRVTAALKRKLDAAAKISGRSQSQEAELRLEQSFRDEKLIIEALSLVYGPRLAGLLLIMGDAMKAVLNERLFLLIVNDDADPFADPWRYQQLKEAAGRVLDRASPMGEITPPPVAHFYVSPVQVPDPGERALKEKEMKEAAAQQQSELGIRAADRQVERRVISGRQDDSVHDLLGPDLIQQLTDSSGEQRS